MKKIALKPSKSVIRVWYNHKVFNKIDYRNPDIPKKPLTTGFLSGEMYSYAENGVLFLGKQKVESDDFQKKNPLLLEYNANQTSRDFFKKVFYTPNWFTIFKNEEVFWLRLLTSDPIFHGYPAREGYELCPLPLQTPVRILINSKNWHSFSGRRATQYYECDYIYEYLGVFSEYELNELPHLQKQTLEGIKTIDLRKELY